MNLAVGASSCSGICHLRVQARSLQNTWISLKMWRRNPRESTYFGDPTQASSQDRGDRRRRLYTTPVDSDTFPMGPGHAGKAKHPSNGAHRRFLSNPWHIPRTQLKKLKWRTQMAFI